MQAAQAQTSEQFFSSLEKGLEYQDFVARELMKHGIVLNNFFSKRGGTEKENSLGMEIKRDGKFRQTGNLYIEVAERRDNAPWKASGVMRDDNNWLYLIGDEQTAYIFMRKSLQALWHKLSSGKYVLGVEMKTTTTSRGFILPIHIAARMAHVVEFSRS